MRSPVEHYRRLVPRQLRSVLTATARRTAWGIGLLRLRMLRPGATPSDRTLALLRFGWGNPLYSASVPFMRAVVEHCRAGTGPIVEAGSGLTTVLIGRLAPADRDALAFEHLPECADRVLARGRAGSCTVRVAPLEDHGGFAWYSLSAPVPDDVGLVVCDGPPGSVAGGRYGALALLRDRLAADAVILLDDADRDPERAVLRRWEAEFGTTTELCGRGPDAYAVVRLP